MKKVPIVPFAVYSIAEVARLLKVSPRVVYKLIKERQLVGKKVGVAYKVLGVNLLRILAPSLKIDIVCYIDKVAMFDIIDTGVMKTINEIAEGLQVSRNTIVSLIKKGEIKAFKVGEQYRIPEESLKSYLNTAGTASYEEFLKSQAKKI